MKPSKFEWKRLHTRTQTLRRTIESVKPSFLYQAVKQGFVIKNEVVLTISMAVAKAADSRSMAQANYRQQASQL